MEQNTWSAQQINAINVITQDFTSKQINKYHIHWLKRLIAKVDFFQSHCATCVDLNPTVDTLITELECIKIDANHEDKTYFSLLNNLYHHLKKDHKVVDVRHYMNWGVVIGVIVGIVASLALQSLIAESVKYGMYVGVIGGFVIGLQLDKKARAEDRVL